MAFLTDEQLAAAEASTVYLATLVELQFASETVRLWNGAGKLEAAGLLWGGLNDMGEISGLAQARDGRANSVTMTLSGVDARVLALALASESDIAGRPAYVWQQMFSSDWAPLGARIPIWWGIMQRAPIERTPAAGTDGGARVVHLEIESPFVDRSRPTHGRYTDADQQARYPGDLFCDLIPSQRMQTVVWPKY